MKQLVTSVLGGAALLGLSMAGAAQAEPDYMFAATGYVGGGGSWLSSNDRCIGGSCDSDIAHIVAGGDIVLPLHGYWNVQLGGAFYTDHLHIFRNHYETQTQFQGSGIGFWRDPTMGVFGVEAGVFSPRSGQRSLDFNSFKIGGVAEYFFSDMITVGGFGGVLLPMDPHPFDRGSPKIETGFYAGGHLTYYASDNLAFAGFVRFTELNEESDAGSSETSRRSLNVGGKVRYLTSMPGVELYAAGAYQKCEDDTTFGQGEGFNSVSDGAQVMGGVKIRLGGHTDSLVSIDRSNAIDTRTWACGNRFIGYGVM